MTSKNGDTVGLGQAISLLFLNVTIVYCLNNIVLIIIRQMLMI
jgi:hypothetical protein